MLIKLVGTTYRWIKSTTIKFYKHKSNWIWTNFGSWKSRNIKIMGAIQKKVKISLIFKLYWKEWSMKKKNNWKLEEFISQLISYDWNIHKYLLKNFGTMTRSMYSSNFVIQNSIINIWPLSGCSTQLVLTAENKPNQSVIIRMMSF